MRLGKVRHIDTHHLWRQEVTAKNKLKCGKIAGEKNCADLLTKHLDQAMMTKHLKTLDIEMNKERSKLALDIKAMREITGRIIARTQARSAAGTRFPGKRSSLCSGTVCETKLVNAVLHSKTEVSIA